MTLTITPVYAALLAVWFIVLSFRVIAARRENRAAYGDGGNLAMQGRIRAQGNFAEYAPFALLLMLMAELGGAAVWALHVVGILLLAGRVVHGIGLSWHPRVFPLRVWGMGLTFTALGVAAILALPL
ncbi:MAG: MAPEG family protein [Paracoccaceae bacterium]